VCVKTCQSDADCASGMTCSSRNQVCRPQRTGN
jgi:hypothetical protein